MTGAGRALRYTAFNKVETVTTQLLLRGHLGSISAITDSLGTIVQALSYDPWGQRRDAATWGELTVLGKQGFDTTRTPRGFTGHEMVDTVGIIHMNGRIYDPALGRFLQADPVIQFPHLSQSHNRYSYVLNNPLAYTDPSGYFIPIFTAVAVGIIASGAVKTLVMAAALIGTGVFADSLVQGVPLDKAFLAGVSAAALTAVAGTTFPLGNFGLNLATAGHVVTVATVGGITTSLQGGRFGHGFLSAGLGSAAPALPGLRQLASTGLGGRALVSAVTAGTVSEITGGKFANAAFSAAFVALVSSAVQRAASARVSAGAAAEASAADREALQAELDSLVKQGVLSRERVFPSEDAAALEVLNAAAPLSKQYGLEVGGSIFQNLDGGYSYTIPVIGGPETVSLNIDYTGYHTHPSGKLLFSNQFRNYSGNPITTDMAWINTSGQALYLGVQINNAVKIGVCSPGVCYDTGIRGTKPGRVLQ